MLTEKEGVDIENKLSQSLDIRKTKLLSFQEYLEETDCEGWVKEQKDSYILKINFYNEPEKHTLKLVSDICMQTKSQIHYLPNQSCCYICPTENDFTLLYTLTHS
jgi:hypothetical protein